jgi:hypothetical protein
MIALLKLLGMKSSRLTGAPRLMSAYLVGGNRAASPRLVPLVLGLSGLLVLALLYRERDWAFAISAWLRQQILGAIGLTIMASAVATARRRVRKRTEFARSWLAALPVRARTAVWETLLIELLPVAAAVAALTGVFLAVAALAAFTDVRGIGTALTVWAAMSGGVIVGAAASYGLRHPKPVDLPPGSRYVPHGRSRADAALRPSLKALGVWPLRLMFARAQPKLVARAILPILVMMPIGTSAAAALCIIAIYVVGGALLLLIPAAISVSGSSFRWMAPLPVRGFTMTRAALTPAIIVILGASAAEGLFLFVIGVSIRASAAAGLCIAGAGCLVTMTAARLWRARLSARNRA